MWKIIVFFANSLPKEELVDDCARRSIIASGTQSIQKYLNGLILLRILNSACVACYKGSEEDVKSLAEHLKAQKIEYSVIDPGKKGPFRAASQTQKITKGG